MPQAPLAKIRRLSRLMKILIIVIAAMNVVGAVYLIWQPLFDWAGFQANIQHYLMPTARQMSTTPFAMAALALIAVANLLLVFTGLATVWRLFDGFEKGLIFSPQSGYRLSRAGFLVFAGTLSLIFSRTVSVVLLTYAGPPGQGVLAINIGTGEALLMLVSGLLLVMGKVMVLATEIDAENRSII